MVKKQNSVLKTLFSVTSIVIIAKMFGFLKQIIIASVFGTTIETDLISLSQGFIGEFDFFIAHALVTALTAVYIKNKDDILESKSIVSGVYKIFVPISIIFALVFFLGAPFFAKIIAPSYTNELSDKLSLYIKIFAPIVILQMIISISSAVLSANKKFLWQQLIGFNQSIIIIMIVFIFKDLLGIDTLIAGFCLAAIFNVFFTGIPAKQYWGLQTKSNPFKNENIRSILRMMLPLLIGYAMIYVNQIVDKILSSNMEEGSVSALSYSSVLLNLVLTFVTSILSVLFVYITGNITKKRFSSANKLVVDSLILLISVFLPISLILCLENKDIVTVVYMRGAFEEKGVNLTSRALLGYGICIVPYCARELFARFLYGHQDSKTPMINSCIGIAVNIVLSIVLSRFWGILGIALGSSISDMICAVLNVFASKKKDKSLLFAPMIRAIPLFVLEAIICIIAFIFGNIILGEFNVWLRFVIVALIGVAGSFIVSLPLLKNTIKALNQEKNQEEISQ